ncbi:hypothetical protein CIK05_11470 [Bdellovibrio sp. qaytius]|nr:hypothetical protein CIK05_11470 [Bdellovibrio sp. qaytius]
MFEDIAYSKFSVSMEMDESAQRLVHYIKQHTTPECKVSLSIEKHLGEFNAVTFIRGLQFEAVIDEKAVSYSEVLDKVKSDFNHRIERLSNGAGGICPSMSFSCTNKH